MDIRNKGRDCTVNAIKKACAVLLVVICLLAAISASGLTDFGDFSGSSDYGGSSYDSYDSYDDDDGDYFFGGGSSGGSGFGGSGPGETVAFFVFFCVVVYFMYRKWKKQMHTASRAPGATPTAGLRPIRDIYAFDPNFSEQAVRERLGNLYVQMQNCWTAKDITPLRGDFTDAQFAQYDRQLQRYRDQEQTPVIERIAVLDVSFAGIKQDDARDMLVANLSTRITTYTLDDKTGKIVKGSPNEEKFMQYEWVLVRPKGTQTFAQEKDAAFSCPNCGAAMNINRSAQCEYCGSIVTRAEYDWVITEIKGLKQETRR